MTHVFVEGGRNVLATNIGSLAAAEYGRWLAAGVAFESVWSPVTGWTHRIVEVAR